MKILVTGAKGMVGTALVNNLKNIKDGKNKTRPGIQIDEIYEYDIDSTPADLDNYCSSIITAGTVTSYLISQALTARRIPKNS